MYDDTLPQGVKVDVVRMVLEATAHLSDQEVRDRLDGARVGPEAAEAFLAYRQDPEGLLAVIEDPEDPRLDASTNLYALLSVQPPEG